MTDVLGNWKSSVGKGSPKYTIPHQQYPARVTIRNNSKNTFTTLATLYERDKAMAQASECDFRRDGPTPGCTDYSPDPDKTSWTRKQPRQAVLNEKRFNEHKYIGKAFMVEKDKNTVHTY